MYVTALLPEHPPQLGRQGQTPGGREPLADLLDRELVQGMLVDPPWTPADRRRRPGPDMTPACAPPNER
jgi:hypothetical protein